MSSIKEVVKTVYNFFHHFCCVYFCRILAMPKRADSEDAFRGFAWTLNNWTPEELEHLKQVKCQYITFGLESAPTTGTPHLQGFVYFKSATTFNAVKHKLGPRVANIKSIKYSAITNANYCQKDPSFFEKGEIPKQGKRNDISEFVADIKEFNPSDAQLITEFPMAFARFPNLMNQAREIFHPAPDRSELLNEFHWGTTGLGKSRAIRLRFKGNLYVKNYQTKWWDGYDKQEAVLFEEVGPPLAKMIYELNTWCDHYAFQVEIKGTMRTIRPKYIIFTSNYSFDEIFQFCNKEKVLDPLKRRIKIVHHTQMNKFDKS